MPTRMGGFFDGDSLKNWEPFPRELKDGKYREFKNGSVNWNGKNGGFSWTKGQRVMEVDVENPQPTWSQDELKEFMLIKLGTMLYNVKEDPHQRTPLDAKDEGVMDIETWLISLMVQLM